MDPATTRPRRRPADERREQLLDAAETVLLRRGLTATTVADVAVEAGVAKGTLYLYFDSKDALLAGLRARYLGDFARAVDATVGSTRASVTTRLDRFVDGLFAFSTEHAALHHVLFHEAGFSEQDALAGGRTILERLIHDGVESGAFAVDDPAIAAGFLLHGLHGLLVDALHGPVSHDRYPAVARALVRRALAAGRAAAAHG